jgi:hypothetical protein
MNSSEIKDAERLPCGCVIGNHIKTNAFVMVPCSETCEYYAYAVEQARKTQKPIAQYDTRRSHVEQARSLSPIFTTNCPYCGSPNDGYSSSDHTNTPTPGDVSICAYCKRIGFFTEHGIRKPTDDEKSELEQDDHIKAMITAAVVVWGE